MTADYPLPGELFSLVDDVAVVTGGGRGIGEGIARTLAAAGAKVVVACPPGEEHDIAALAVAYRCRVRGCRVYYLGANVPIASLANLCRTVKPDLTLISLPLAQSNDKATELVEHLTREVAPASRVAVGGNGALDMRDLFEKAHIEIVESFVELDMTLDRLTRQSVSRT